MTPIEFDGGQIYTCQRFITNVIICATVADISPSLSLMRLAMCKCISGPHKI